MNPQTADQWGGRDKSPFSGQMQNRYIRLCETAQNNLDKIILEMLHLFQAN